MTSTDTSWFPASGRHAVSVGPSLGRALKARRGIAPSAKAKRANLPDREFYSFRCKRGTRNAPLTLFIGTGITGGYR